MKKLIAMAVAILLTACIAVFASGKEAGSVPPKQINYGVSFSKIIVADDIDLQLKESSNKIIDVTGEDADVEKVDWEIRNDILYLTSRKGSLKSKVKVTVTVAGLKEIFVKGKSNVSSVGYLHSPDLSVYPEDDCLVSIKNMGQINIINNGYIELDVRKMVGDVMVGEL